MSQQENSNFVQIVQTINKGEIPSTELIQSELQPTKEFLAEKEKSATSVEKETAFHETRLFLEAFEKLLVEKKVSDRLSRLLDAAKRVGDHGDITVYSPETMKRETRQFVEAVKELIPDLIKSKEFRSSILELFIVLRDIISMKVKEHGGSEKLEEAFVNNDKSQAKEVVGEAKKAIDEVQSGEISDEQKSRMREQLKNLLKSLRKYPSTKNTFQKFLNLWDILSTELSLQLDRENVNVDVKEVQITARDLIEAFSGKTVDAFIAKIRKLNETVQNDNSLRDYLQDFRNFIRKGLESPEETLDTDQFINEGDDIIKRGREIADKYKNDEVLNDLVDEAQSLIDGIKTDELVQNLQIQAQKVAEAFTYTDITGKTHLDTDLISQMKSDLVPFLLNHIKDIPLPGIKIEDENFEYLEIANLKVKLEDILPEKIIIHSSNDTEITIKNFEAPTTSDTMLKFRMEGIRPEFHDFDFGFKRRGLIPLEDVGKANLKITGSGVVVKMNFDVELDSQMRALLTNHHVSVAIDGIDLTVLHSEYKTFLNVVSTLFAPKIKSEFENALKKRIEEIGNEWAGVINKRILSAVPMKSVGESVQKAITDNVPILGDNVFETKTKDVPLQGTVTETTVKHNP